MGNSAREGQVPVCCVIRTPGSAGEETHSWETVPEKDKHCKALFLASEENCRITKAFCLEMWFIHTKVTAALCSSFLLCLFHFSDSHRLIYVERVCFREAF